MQHCDCLDLSFLAICNPEPNSSVRIVLFVIRIFFFQSEPLSVFKVNHHSLCVFIGVWPLHFYLLIVNELILWKKVKIRKIVEKLKTEACICSMDPNHCIFRGHNLPTALGATPDCC